MVLRCPAWPMQTSTAAQPATRRTSTASSVRRSKTSGWNARSACVGRNHAVGAGIAADKGRIAREMVMKSFQSGGRLERSLFVYAAGTLRRVRSRTDLRRVAAAGSEAPYNAQSSKSWVEIRDAPQPISVLLDTWQSRASSSSSLCLQLFVRRSGSLWDLRIVKQHSLGECCVQAPVQSL